MEGINKRYNEVKQLRFKNKEQREEEAKKLGFSSLEEKNLYSQIGLRLIYLYNEKDSEVFNEIKQRYYKAITKEQKIALLDEFGLLDLVGEYEKLSEEQRLESDKEFLSSLLDPSINNEKRGK